MADKYKVEKILSVGKKGKMMVSVRVGNKTVTRHLVHGIGRHPDDSIPALHERHGKRVDALRERVRELTKGIVGAEEEVARNGKDADAARTLLPIARLARTTSEADLVASVAAQEQELLDNPLMVEYYQEGA
jgi:hypothetical protein